MKNRYALILLLLITIILGTPLIVYSAPNTTIEDSGQVISDQIITEDTIQDANNDRIIIVKVPESQPVTSEDKASTIDKLATFSTALGVAVAVLAILFGAGIVWQTIVFAGARKDLRTFLHDAEEASKKASEDAKTVADILESAKTLLNESNTKYSLAVINNEQANVLLTDAIKALEESNTACAEAIESKDQAFDALQEAAAAKEQANKAIIELEPILRNIKKIEQELIEVREKAVEPNLSESPSEETKEKLDEYGGKVKIAEKVGIPLIYEDCISLGTDYYYKGEYHDALQLMEKAIELKPMNPGAWYNKGVILGILESYNEALKSYEQAIELSPDLHDAWINKGSILIKFGRFDEALQAFEKAIQLREDLAMGWANKGSALIKLGRIEEAEQACNRAIEIDSKWNIAWYNMACVKCLKGEKQESLVALQKVIQLDLKHKDIAKTDEDFKPLWDDEDFKKLVE